MRSLNVRVSRLRGVCHYKSNNKGDNMAKKFKFSLSVEADDEMEARTALELIVAQADEKGDLTAAFDVIEGN